MTAAPIFLSHGSPLLVLEATATTAFLRGLGQRIGRPKAVLAVSAHWTTEQPRVGAAAQPRTIHDFAGFPAELSRLRYPAPGAPELARRAARLLDCPLDEARGLDHGIWCPASLIWPEADVPIVPLAVQPRRDPAHHYRLGQALRPLAEDGVLILATGALTHNLGEYFHRRVDDPAETWATGFADWTAQALAEGRVMDLLDYRAQAPHAARNHPSDEHLLPLFTALGASASGRAVRLHSAVEYGVLAMDAFGFG